MPFHPNSPLSLVSFAAWDRSDLDNGSGQQSARYLTKYLGSQTRPVSGYPPLAPALTPGAGGLTPKFGVAIATKRSKILYHKELQANLQIALETVGDGWDSNKKKSTSLRLMDNSPIRSISILTVSVPDQFGIT